jgi:hypothetical protein
VRTYVNQSAAGLKATITPAFSTLESLTFLIGRLSAHYALFLNPGCESPVIPSLTNKENTQAPCRSCTLRAALIEGRNERPNPPVGSLLR